MSFGAVHKNKILSKISEFTVILQKGIFRSNSVVFHNFYVVFCLVFAMLLYASVYMCLVVTCWERADLLALVLGVYL